MEYLKTNKRDDYLRVSDPDAVYVSSIDDFLTYLLVHLTRRTIAFVDIFGVVLSIK